MIRNFVTVNCKIIELSFYNTWLKVETPQSDDDGIVFTKAVVTFCVLCSKLYWVLGSLPSSPAVYNDKLKAILRRGQLHFPWIGCFYIAILHYWHFPFLKPFPMQWPYLLAQRVHRTSCRYSTPFLALLLYNYNYSVVRHVLEECRYRLKSNKWHLWDTDFITLSLSNNGIPSRHASSRYVVESDLSLILCSSKVQGTYSTCRISWCWRISH